MDSFYLSIPIKVNILQERVVIYVGEASTILHHARHLIYIIIERTANRRTGRKMRSIYEKGAYVQSSLVYAVESSLINKTDITKRAILPTKEDVPAI